MTSVRPSVSLARGSFARPGSRDEAPPGAPLPAEDAAKASWQKPRNRAEAAPQRTGSPSARCRPAPRSGRHPAARYGPVKPADECGKNRVEVRPQRDCFACRWPSALLHRPQGGRTRRRSAGSLANSLRRTPMTGTPMRSACGRLRLSLGRCFDWPVEARSTPFGEFGCGYPS